MNSPLNAFFTFTEVLNIQGILDAYMRPFQNHPLAGLVTMFVKPIVKMMIYTTLFMTLPVWIGPYIWYCLSIRWMRFCRSIVSTLNEIRRQGLWYTGKRLYAMITNTTGTLKDIWNSMSTLSLLTIPMWVSIWCMSWTAQQAWNRGVQAGEKVKRTVSRVYELGDNLFGRIYYRVNWMRDRAQVVINSYSQLPEHISLQMIQDHLRRNAHIVWLRDLVLQNVRIPVVVRDLIRGTESVLSLELEDGELSLRSSSSASGKIRRRKIDVRSVGVQTSDSGLFY